MIDAPLETVLASAVITVSPVGDEDGQIIEVPECTVSITNDRDDFSSFYGSREVKIILHPKAKAGNGYLYRMKILEGAITKGARALWLDKNPGQDPPVLSSLARGELATRLRRRAKAVLDAAKS